MSKRTIHACGLTAFAVLAISALGLIGCSSAGQTATGHQVIDGTAECMMCHSDDRSAVNMDSSMATVQCGSTITVETSADKIVLCNAYVASIDETYVVPKEYKSFTVTDGSVDIDLEAGVWVLCIDNGDSSDYVVVNSDPSNSEATVVNM